MRSFQDGFIPLGYGSGTTTFDSLISPIDAITKLDQKKGIEINNATFNVSKSIITNGIYEEERDKPGFVRINGICIWMKRSNMDTSAMNMAKSLPWKTCGKKAASIPAAAPASW